MSYIYTHNRSAYYSDSDESYGGCECVPNPCPPKDPAYTVQLVEVFVPPPGLNPNLNGFLYQLNSNNNYPKPDNNEELTNAVYDDLQQYSYLWTNDLNYGVSDNAGNIQYTIYFRIGAFPAPNPTQYAFDQIWAQTLNPNTQLTGPFNALTWNGVEIFSGAYWTLKCDFIDINDTPDLRVLFEASQPTNTEPQIDLNCNPVRFGFRYEATTPPEDPIARYSESPTGIQVLSDPPRDSWQECDELLTGRIVADSGTIEMPWYCTRRFNSAYWSIVPTNIRITVSVSTQNRRYFTDWNSFTAAGGGLVPGTQGVTVNAGSRTPFSTASGWPTLTFPYKDGPSTEWPAPGHEQDFFINFQWPLSMQNDQELEAQYEYLDATNNIIETHFQKDFVTRKPLSAIVKQIVPPLDPCWNSDVTYDRPLSQVAVDGGGYLPADSQLWTTPGGQSLPIWTVESRPTTVSAASEVNTMTIPADTNSPNRHIMMLKGSAAPTFYVQLPIFKKDGEVKISFRNTRYRDVFDTQNFAGAPRNVTWSICDPFGSGTLANGQWTILQDSNSFSRDFATTGTIQAFADLPDGLYYVRLNLNSLPDGDTFDAARRVQWMEHITTSLPANATLGYVPATTEITGKPFNSTIDQTGGSNPFSTEQVCIWDLPDMYPGDNGRSINMYYRAPFEMRPGPALPYETLTNFNLFISPRRYWNVINMRDYYDPVNQQIRIEFASGNFRDIGGFTYLKQVV